VPAKFNENVDVVIVGSGPAGATYARMITDERPQTTVLVVEAGPVVTNPPGLHMANIIDPDEREQAQIASQGPNQFRYPLQATSGTAHNRDGATRAVALLTRPGLFKVGSGAIDGAGFPAAQESSNVGGMGSHWFGACPRPNPIERIGFLDDAELEDAYEVAERLLRVSNTQFAGSPFAEHVETVLGNVLNADRAPNRRVQPMPMAVTLTEHGVHRSGPNVIFDELLNGVNESFELRPDTLCERVVMEGDRAVGVQLRDRATGTVYTVGASQVVVAADALRTPQVLFASGVRPAALGHYLNEHPQVSIMAEVDGIGADEGHKGERGSSTAMSDSTAVAVAASGVTWIPYEGEAFPFHGMLAQIDPDTVPRSSDDERERKPLISVHFFIAQELQWDNQLEFSESEVDWIGMPAMKINYTLSPRDLEILDQGKDEVLRLSNALGKPADGESPWVLPFGSSLHYQGTVRMGERNDGLSVCDSTSRVWDTANLFVAGNGVIPTSTACNPTLTHVALAVLSAREIVRQLDRIDEVAAV
jgi:choline dehydrogenase-like flavoprotein